MNSMKSFFQGTLTALVAQMSAWALVEAGEGIAHLCGHITVELIAHVFDILKR
jgi:hypothetical protein